MVIWNERVIEVISARQNINWKFCHLLMNNSCLAAVSSLVQSPLSGTPSNAMPASASPTFPQVLVLWPIEPHLFQSSAQFLSRYLYPMLHKLFPMNFRLAKLNHHLLGRSDCPPLPSSNTLASNREASSCRTCIRYWRKVSAS